MAIVLAQHDYIFSYLVTFSFCYIPTAYALSVFEFLGHFCMERMGFCWAWAFAYTQTAILGSVRSKYMMATAGTRIKQQFRHMWFMSCMAHVKVTPVIVRYSFYIEVFPVGMVSHGQSGIVPWVLMNPRGH
jgi:hypothetical protein